VLPRGARLVFKKRGIVTVFSLYCNSLRSRDAERQGGREAGKRRRREAEKHEEENKRCVPTSVRFASLLPGFSASLPSSCFVRLSLRSRLEQLDSVTIRIFQLNLLACRTNFDLISKMKTRFGQARDN